MPQQPIRYEQLLTLVALFRPRSIIEVGTNKGDRGIAMCREALRYRHDVAYRGFDVFDSEDARFHEEAFNGKGFFAQAQVSARFAELQAQAPRFSFELTQGRTSETLHGRSFAADLVFIDGDHRASTIARDYRAVRHSKIVVFDDYYEPGSNRIDSTQLGCNSVVDALDRMIVLPSADTFDHVGAIRMVALIRPHWTTRRGVVWLPW